MRQASFLAGGTAGRNDERGRLRPGVLMPCRELSRQTDVVCCYMKDRELEAKVVRFVREIGISLEGKVRTVGFDFTRGMVVISTDEAMYGAPAAGLWSDYADNMARIRPQHVRLIKCPDGEPSQVPTTGEPRVQRGLV